MRFCVDLSNIFMEQKGGAYCILEGCLEVGRRLLAGCCIVYLSKGGGYCILGGGKMGGIFDVFHGSFD